MDDPTRQPGPLGTEDRPPVGGRWWVNVVILAAVAGALFLIFFFRPFGRPNPENNPAVGSPLLAVELRGLTGTEEDELGRDDLDGQVVLLHFWATWCPPCRAELPHIEALAKKLDKVEGAKLVAVCSDQARTEAEFDALRMNARRVLEAADVDLPTYADPTGMTFGGYEALVEASGEPAVIGFPTTLLIDRGGMIRAVWVGFVPGFHEDMEKRVKRLVELQPAPG